MSDTSVRRDLIAVIIDKLRKIQPTPMTTYAITENIRFFRASRSMWSYVTWLLTAGRLDARRLLEINELLPEYDKQLHDSLIEIERKKFPGIIEGAVQYLELLRRKVDADRIRIGSIGSGGCEVERQFIERTLRAPLGTGKVTIVAFDISIAAHDRAEENLESLKSERIRMVRVPQLTAESLRTLETETTQDMLVVFAHNDIFTLDSIFEKQTFTVLMSVLFLHHLPRNLGVELVRLMERAATYVMHYDGYRSLPHMIIQSFAGWKQPVFMNAAVFSNLRFWTKRGVSEAFAHMEVVSYSHGHFRAATKL